MKDWFYILIIELLLISIDMFKRKKEKYFTTYILFAMIQSKRKQKHAIVKDISTKINLKVLSEIIFIYLTQLAQFLLHKQDYGGSSGQRVHKQKGDNLNKTDEHFLKKNLSETLRLFQPLDWINSALIRQLAAFLHCK